MLVKNWDQVAEKRSAIIPEKFAEICDSPSIIHDDGGEYGQRSDDSAVQIGVAYKDCLIVPRGCCDEMLQHYHLQGVHPAAQFGISAKLSLFMIELTCGRFEVDIECSGIAGLAYRLVPEV